MATVLHPDPFSAVLLTSPPLMLTDEQRLLAREVIDIASADTQFADKAWRALVHILTGGPVVVPEVTSLVPNSAEIGDVSFTLHVHGTGFTSTSIIVFAGQEEPTTFVSATEITTGVNMTVWLGPDVLPVSVLSADGVMSSSMPFTFTDGSVATLGLPPSHAVKTPSTVHSSFPEKR